MEQIDLLISLTKKLGILPLSLKIQHNKVSTFYVESGFSIETSRLF